MGIIKRSLTTETFKVPGRGGTDAIVTISRWRLSSGTACIHVHAVGPEGVKSWEAKSQGPSSGGFNKAVQAASRIHFKISGRWGSESSENVEQIADVAAAAVGCRPAGGGGLRINPRRRKYHRRGRRNPSYTEGLAEVEAELRRDEARRAYGSRRRNPSRGSADEHAANELVLYATNDQQCYRQAQAIMENLAKKIRKGVYDKTKAVKLWGYLADTAAQHYTREFGSPGPHASYGIFSKATRMAAAAEFADHYAEELAEKAGTRSNPRHRRTKMARRKYRRTHRRSSKGYRGGVRVVRFRTRGGRVKIVRFHKPGTKAGRRGSAAKRAAGKRLAKRYGFFRKGRAIYQKRPGKKSKLIRRL